MLRVDVAGEIGLSRRPVLAEILVHGLDSVAAIGVEPERVPVDRARRVRGALRTFASVGDLGGGSPAGVLSALSRRSGAPWPALSWASSTIGRQNTRARAPNRATVELPGGDEFVQLVERCPARHVDRVDDVAGRNRAGAILAADEGYDCNWLRDSLRELGIRPLIKHCVHAPYDHAHNARIDEELYAQRSMTETVFSSLKRSLGSAVRARAWYREFREIVLMCLVYNIKRLVTPREFHCLRAIQWSRCETWKCDDPTDGAWETM